uniref:Uncharacterized protein n=1 Tax=Siphoviridae sp. ctiMP24 TaxID=2825621 RepID=A0A8S5P016_9CAUD|nr:MAG TPA: hypothetical protein [Siphoviridae sp. ctiMP24]
MSTAHLSILQIFCLQFASVRLKKPRFYGAFLFYPHSPKCRFLP